MKQLVPILVGLTLLSQLSQARHSNLHEWREYKLKYGKVYESAEEDARRFGLFLAAKDKIRQHNAMNSRYTLGLNHLADLAPEELSGSDDYHYQHKSSTSYQTDQNAAKAAKFLARLSAANSNSALPEEVDWRKHGRVTSVKDEGSCRSSWAFAGAGALEGQELVRTKMNETKSLSVQSIIDCSESMNSCDGSYGIKDALMLVAAYGGIEAEENYPYTGKQGKCASDSRKSIILNDGYSEFGTLDNHKLMALVANYGPVSVKLATTDWQYYQSGVFDSLSCNTGYQGALLVGYGRDPKLGHYWLVKNSWSDKWGEAGYIRLSSDHYYTCQMGDYIVIPTWVD